MHIDAEDAPDDLVALRISAPDDVTELAYGPASVPADWQQTPSPPQCQAIGSEWARRREELLLRIPSVLVNPMHPDAVGVRFIGSRHFSYDLRLLT